MDPIVICGVDFSGTSMLAGMCHAAGVDMGDVETQEEVSNSNGPIRYPRFEDKLLQEKIQPLAVAWQAGLPDISPLWVDQLYEMFSDYLAQRQQASDGKRWGVKCNGLLYLIMHPAFSTLPVRWLTTARNFDDSMESCFRKMGNEPRYAAMMGIEYLAWSLFMDTPHVTEFGFEDMLYYHPEGEAKRLCLKLFGNTDKYTDVLSVINPQTKGVIPCHPLT